MMSNTLEDWKKANMVVPIKTETKHYRPVGLCLEKNTVKRNQTIHKYLEDNTGISNNLHRLSRTTCRPKLLLQSGNLSCEDGIKRVSIIYLDGEMMSC